VGLDEALQLNWQNVVAVVCADINLEAAEETVKLIEQLGQKAFAVQCDVGKQNKYNFG
jgi:hypothetical protein